MFDLKYLPDVATLKLDVEKCSGCRMCIKVCPHEVFAIDDRTAKPRKVMIVELDACMECGACALNCPDDALEVDSGVGCAAAVINGWIRRSEPVCDCSGDPSSSGC